MDYHDEKKRKRKRTVAYARALNERARTHTNEKVIRGLRA
jgi:hypothetical protein